jgi:hypothetical protein
MQSKLHKYYVLSFLKCDCVMEVFIDSWVWKFKIVLVPFISETIDSWDKCSTFVQNLVQAVVICESVTVNCSYNFEVCNKSDYQSKPCL